MGKHADGRVARWRTRLQAAGEWLDANPKHKMAYVRCCSSRHTRARAGEGLSCPSARTLDDCGAPRGAESRAAHRAHPPSN